MTNQLIETYLKKLKTSGIERHIPNISVENAEFIKGIIRDKNPKRMLEIGTANGYSGIHFSSILSEWSSLTTIEYAWNAHIEAVENFKECKIKNIISIWGDAKMVIPTLSDNYFDVVYIDAMKREYLDYLLLSLPKMTEDAIIIIDDVIKFRDKMTNLYEFLDRNGIEYNICSTDPDDGIMIINFSDIWKTQFLQDR